MSRSIPTEELCDRFERLYTGLVADVLDTYGRTDQTMDPELTPLDRSQTFAGVAFPATGRPNRGVDHEQQMRRFLEMIGDAPEHSVLALEANDERAAQIGELTTTALAAQGCRGVVVDGGLRDTAFVRDQGFPVVRRHQTPADSIHRWELLDWDATAVVGGVEVAPGDVVVGDVDGVVVVPASIAEDVLVDAEEMRETEDDVRDAIREGATPVEAYDEHGTF